MVTLTGPTGCGKTRLALEVATRLRRSGLERLWWCGMSPVADPARVANTSIERLEIHASPNVPLPRLLAGALAKDPTLLLLDNCEHLVSGCAELGHYLLAECPRLRVLCTSLQPLGLPEETLWTVPRWVRPIPKASKT